MAGSRPKLNPTTTLGGLFKRAKEREEFEYICALSGLYTMGHGVNLLAETWALVRDIVGLLQGPLQREARLRLGLLLYCHLLEAKPIYAILDNMLSAVEGDRCAWDPFFGLTRKKKKDEILPEFIPPSSKIVFETVIEHAKKAGENDLATMLDVIHDSGLRNAFFHADYCIVGERIESKNARFRDGQGRSQSISIEHAFSNVQNAIAFYEAFENVYAEHRLSYQEPKQIQGRLSHDDSYVDIYVHVDPNGGGLTGFGSMPEPRVDSPKHTESHDNR